MKRRRFCAFCILFLVTTLCLFAKKEEVLRVACVGNSVTYGYALPQRETQCYPAQLQHMLGDRYEVRNFGHSGATLLRHGHRPYMNLPEFQEAINFKPDMVVIHLGLNDTDPRDWPDFGDEFIPDYRALIDSFRVANPKAKIWICRMTPIFDRHTRFQSGTRDWHAKIQTAIEQVAQGSKTGLIDLYEPLHERPDLFPDALHPNPEGAQILARTVYGHLTGQHGGLRMPSIYGDNMVLQCEQPIRISGTANSGCNVNVTLRPLNERRSLLTAQTVVAENGHWSVQLPARPAGGPYSLTIQTDAKEKAEYNNVWLGDVWLFSGQSNMTFKTCEMSNADAQLTLQEASRQPLHIMYMRERYLTNADAWTTEQLDTVNALGYFDLSAGWRLSDNPDMPYISAIATHMASILADSLQRHIGVIVNSVGGSATESWIPRSTLEWEYPQILADWKNNDHVQAWVRQRARQNSALRDTPLQQHPYAPAYLFAAGMIPLEHFAMKGVVWYQGESNAHNMELHERLFHLLVDSWREWQGDKQLPFLFVQLSSLNRPSWPRFRDSQRRLANETNHCWMAVSSDKGDSIDVHPKDKRPIAERLAAQALGNVYGYKIETQGPEIQRATHNAKGQVTLTFTHAEGLHTPQDGLPTNAFEICGDDGLFYPANFKIENDRVVLNCPSISHPCKVRFGWQPFTRAALYNKAEYPTSTFLVDIENP